MQALLAKAFTILGTVVGVMGGGAGLYEAVKAAISFRDGDGSQARNNLIGAIAGFAAIGMGVLIGQIPSMISI